MSRLNIREAAWRCVPVMSLLPPPATSGDWFEGFILLVLWGVPGVGF